MARDRKPATKEQAFEMIELAIDDLQLLSRAFEVVKKVCEEVSLETCGREDCEEGVPPQEHALIH